MKMLGQLIVALFNGFASLFLLTFVCGLIGALGGLIAAMCDAGKVNWQNNIVPYALQGFGSVGSLGGFFGLALGTFMFFSTLENYEKKSKLKEDKSV